MVAYQNPLRIAFFGTPAFAVPTLTLLAESHDVTVVVTQPDRPKGRGQRPQSSPAKQFAVSRGLAILQPDRLKDVAVLEALREHQPDVGVVAAYGKILPEELLRLARLGMINVHASILPRYRGASPVHRAIMNGETETGVTIMRVVKALDAGPMLAVARRAIGPDETSVEVERDLAQLGAALLLNTLPAIADGTITETPQDETQATYAPRLTKEEGHIRWTDTALVIHNQVRGLHPWPHAYTFLNAARLIVLRTSLSNPRLEPGTTAPPPPHVPDSPDLPSTTSPGAIVRAAGDELLVAAGRNTVIRILSLQPEGRRPMTAREFLSGHAVPVGSTLS